MKTDPNDPAEITKGALGELLVDVYNRGRLQGRREVEREYCEGTVSVQHKCKNCKYPIIKVTEAMDWVHVTTFDGRTLEGMCEPDMQSMWAER